MMNCDTTRQNETTVKSFFTADSMKNNTQMKRFFLNNLYCFSQSLVDFQAEVTERQIYISPFTYENNSDEVHITGCFGKRPETKQNRTS